MYMSLADMMLGVVKHGCIYGHEANVHIGDACVVISVMLQW